MSGDWLTVEPALCVRMEMSVGGGELEGSSRRLAAAAGRVKDRFILLLLAPREEDEAGSTFPFFARADLLDSNGVDVHN